ALVVHFPVRAAEKRQQDLVLELRRGWLPFDVSATRIRRVGAQGELGVPVFIARTGAGMGRPRDDDEAEAEFVACSRQLSKRLAAAQGGTDGVVVDDSVAMGASLARLRNRGKVQVAHAEVAQVREYPANVVEPEVGVKLKAVRRDHRLA